MKIIVLSRYEIELVRSWTEPCVVVSIRTPGVRYANIDIPEMKRLVYLGFSDDDPFALKRSLAAKGVTRNERLSLSRRLGTVMTLGQALQVVSLWRWAEEEGLTSFIVQCEAGISRSRGVAEGLAVAHPGSVYDRGGSPNIHCKSLVLQAWRGETWGAWGNAPPQTPNQQKRRGK